MTALVSSAPFTAQAVRSYSTHSPKDNWSLVSGSGFSLLYTGKMAEKNRHKVERFT